MLGTNIRGWWGPEEGVLTQHVCWRRGAGERRRSSMESIEAGGSSYR